jgi:gamma-glutamylcyclotransferase (GGCT)/AIG2-like uncharacterized protein YtfP
MRLFVYGTMMSGQRDHAVVERFECVGCVQTKPLYTLVDIDRYAALTSEGTTSIHGELYLLDEASLALVDRACGAPHLFHRKTLSLLDDTPAESHFMTMEQLRGKRRLPTGNWLERFAPRPSSVRESAMARYARERWRKT